MAKSFGSAGYDCQGISESRLKKNNSAILSAFRSPVFLLLRCDIRTSSISTDTGIQNLLIFLPDIFLPYFFLLVVVLLGRVCCIVVFVAMMTPRMKALSEMTHGRVKRFMDFSCSVMVVRSRPGRWSRAR